MKTKVLLMVFAAAAIALTSCDDDDNIRVSPAVQEAFSNQYPDATRISWEMKAGFYVADFLLHGTESEAWYSTDAIWHMTETDILYPDLPQAVRTAHESGEYAAWKREDVDKLEREGVETVYVIEVEKGETEYDLYYSTDGILIKAVPDGGGSHNYLPSELPAAVKQYIDTHHNGARIVEAEREKGKIEVDIIENKIAKELLFTLEGEWISTKTEVRYAEVPEIVKQARLNSEYGTWDVDDVDFYETPTVHYYKFELEKGDREIDLRIDTEGNILK